MLKFRRATALHHSPTNIDDSELSCRNYTAFDEICASGPQELNHRRTCGETSEGNSKEAAGGGFKYSGIGREWDQYGIETFVETRAILEP